MIEVTWGARTHQGHRRSRNEDAFIARPPLFAVADGMGGHAAGNLASSLAVEALSRAANTAHLSRLEALDAVRDADRRIADRAHEPDAAGMGTTLTGLALTTSQAGHALVFNVGDSRSYVLRDHVLHQITHDHSVVQELVDSGALTPSEAEQHPDRNVITRSLGLGEHLDIDWWTFPPLVGDRFLLCSDGLTKELTIDTIRGCLDDAPSSEEAAAQLLEHTLATPARDNVTVVVVEVVRITAEALAADDEDTLPRSTPSRPPVTGAAP